MKILKTFFVIPLCVLALGLASTGVWGAVKANPIADLKISLGQFAASLAALSKRLGDSGGSGVRGASEVKGSQGPESGTPASGQWACPACTFLNELAAQACEMCESPKMTKVEWKQQQKAIKQIEEQKRKEEEQKKAEEKKFCFICQKGHPANECYTLPCCNLKSHICLACLNSYLSIDIRTDVTESALQETKGQAGQPTTMTIGYKKVFKDYLECPTCRTKYSLSDLRKTEKFKALPEAAREVIDQTISANDFGDNKAAIQKKYEEVLKEKIEEKIEELRKENGDIRKFEFGILVRNSSDFEGFEFNDAFSNILRRFYRDGGLIIITFQNGKELTVTID